MKLLSYQDHHFDGVEQLWQQCFPNDPPRNQAGQSIPAKLAIGARLGRDLIVIAENDAGEVVGSVMGGYDGHRGWLYAVAVRPDQQRRGIGALLVEKACRKLRGVGCSKVNLQIRAGNDAVAAFYQSLGFEIEPRTSMGRSI